ncbi:hypothetical protein [Streptomyces sp. NPDC048489]|uniref:hypothetical protein n=1 Tax=Streptomyces sp. NPDC048489 TaxID=3154504 RepID=UPI00343D2499
MSSPNCAASSSIGNWVRPASWMPGSPKGGNQTFETDGRQWEAWLHLDIVAALKVEDPEDMDDSSVWWGSREFTEAARLIRAELDTEAPDVAASAIAWAASAGVAVPAQARIEEVLRSKEDFAEEVFFNLLDALGFPAAAEPSPEH